MAWELHCQQVEGVIGDEMCLGKTTSDSKNGDQEHRMSLSLETVFICLVMKRARILYWKHVREVSSGSSEDEELMKMGKRRRRRKRGSTIDQECSHNIHVYQEHIWKGILSYLSIWLHKDIFIFGLTQYCIFSCTLVVPS